MMSLAMRLWLALGIGLMAACSVALVLVVVNPTRSTTQVVELAFSLLTTGAAVEVLVAARRRRIRAAQHERSIAERTSLQVAAQVGADPELANLANAGFMVKAGGDLHGPFTFGQQEVDRRVDEATSRLAEVVARLDAQEAAADQLRERLRSVEDMFPEPSEFQKYADANQLYLAYQLGELAKRLERIESGQLSRFQVVGIVVTTLVAAVAVASGVVVLLQVAHVVH
jgi:hypothetical protein